VACTGVHGANRLASNSLLETVVFGQRAALAAVEFARRHPILPDPSRFRDYVSALPRKDTWDNQEIHRLRGQTQKVMWDLVGLVRCNDSLTRAQRVLEELTLEVEELTAGVWSKEALELKNILLIGRLITKAALTRQESRGAHFRTDVPEPNEAWRKHIILQRDQLEPEFSAVD
jgi:aspartate oxidase